MTIVLWRQLGKVLFASLRIVLRPDKYWFRPWAIYAFRIMPLLAVTAILSVISVPLSFAARQFQRLAGG